MIRFFATVVLCLSCQFGTPSHAQTFDVSNTKPGRVYEFQSSLGASQIRFIGEDGARFRYEYRRDNSKGSPRTLTNWTDNLGRTVKIKEGNVVLKFSPHDCWLMPGECRFTVTPSSGGKFRMVQVGRLTGNTFHYEVFERNTQPRNLKEHGWVKVDPNGVPLSREYVDDRGNAHWVKRR